jgi:asparagine N-glycosylation enzyme membrane subunit Stt3
MAKQISTGGNTKKSILDNAFKLNKIVYWIVIGIILLVGTGFRFMSYSNVVTDNTVQLKGADAYSFTRQAEWIKNTGQLPAEDNLMCFPDGIQYDKAAGLYPSVIAFMGNFMSLEMATAISSPIFAGLLLVVILFLLREVFKKNDYAVIGGLAVVAFTGIQFISRSYFGFGDRHVLETLLFSLGMFGFIKAINKGSYLWIAFSAIGFALYNYSWSQASLMLLIFGVGAILTFLFKDKISPKMLKFLLIVYAVQLIPALLFSNAQLAGLSIGLAVLSALAYFVRTKVKVKWQRLLVILLGLGALMLFMNLAFQEFFARLLNVIDSYANPKNVGPAVSEAAPMFSIYSSIEIFDTVFLQIVLFMVGIYGLVLALKKQNYIFFFAGISLMVLSLIRIRSEYYFLIFAGIGVAYAINRFKKLFFLVIACVILFFIQYVSAWSSDLAAQRSSLAFTNSDYKMGEWMRENLPRVTDTDNVVPEYGVLADWTLGYLYTYISKSAMFAEPNFCHYIDPTRVFIMSNETEAYSFMKANNLKYILVKPMDINKFYYNLTQLKVEKQMMAVSGTVDGEQKLFVNQKYFQSMGARLYNFNGDAVVPTQVYTITADKQLLEFSNYEEAKAAGALDFFSLDTNSSPVPLDALKHFKLIHSESDSRGGVKLFEVID